MLAAFESALVGLAVAPLAGRGLVVTGAGGVPAAPAAGGGRVALGVTAAGPDPGRGFAPSGLLPPLGPARVRVVPLAVEVAAVLIRRATAADDAALHEARRLLLEDVTLLVHALDADAVRDGTAWPAAGDPGFRVTRFGFAGLTAVAPVAGDLVQAGATFTAAVLVWPPAPPEQTGVIDEVEPEVEVVA